MARVLVGLYSTSFPSLGFIKTDWFSAKTKTCLKSIIAFESALVSHQGHDADIMRLLKKGNKLWHKSASDEVRNFRDLQSVSHQERDSDGFRLQGQLGRKGRSTR